jgi:hypothetical protein
VSCLAKIYSFMTRIIVVVFLPGVGIASGQRVKESIKTTAYSLPNFYFCRPDQYSLTNSYVDDNSCLISEWLASLFLHDDFASRHLHIQLSRNDYTVPTRCRHRGEIVDLLG